MYGEGGVVGFHDSIGHLGTGHNGVRAHHPVGVFLANFGDKECTHTGSGSTTERVGDLETWAIQRYTTYRTAVKQVITNLEDSLYPPPLFGLHRERSRRARLLRCNLDHIKFEHDGSRGIETAGKLKGGIGKKKTHVL